MQSSLCYPLFHAKKGKPAEPPVPLAPLADTHGHLTAFRKRDPADAIARAALVGVRLLVVPVDPADDVPDAPTFLEWFGRVRDGAARLLEEAACAGAMPPTFAGFEGVPALVDNLHFVAGVHPYGARKLMEDKSVRTRLEALLDDSRCVGVGEFGLDIGPWSELTLEEQVPAFRLQLRMAHERNLPVELHIRDGEGGLATAAHDRALDVLREEGVPAAGCDLHCFTSGPEAMAPFVDLGCHIAFGGAMTFGRSDDIRAAAVACPEHLILSETDSPYMAPVPLRGQECEPAMVAFTVERLAHVRTEGSPTDTASLTEVYATLWRNAVSFFGFG